MVRAYWLLLDRAAPGEVYNAASGRARSIREVLDGFLGLAGRSIEVRPTAERVRPVDLPLLLGDASRLRALTGWAPRISFEESLADVLADWRRRCRPGGPGRYRRPSSSLAASPPLVPGVRLRPGLARLRLLGSRPGPVWRRGETRRGGRSYSPS
jgi:hypothetical protein